MDSKPLTDELYREYELPGGKLYRIDNPQALYVGKTSHRVLDNNGVVHCIPWTNDTVLRWYPKDPANPVQF